MLKTFLMYLCSQSLLHTQPQATTDMLPVTRDYSILSVISYKMNRILYILLYLASFICLVILRFFLDIVYISNSFYILAHTISLYGYIKICFSFILLMAIWIVSSFCLSCCMTYDCFCANFYGNMLSFHFDK